MPYLERPGTVLFYEDIGEGSPIITLPGFLETTAYWSVTGLAGRLSLTHRVISMDLRYHGRSRPTDAAEPATPEAHGEDIDALADHLGLERFHLLTHATGGMAGVRYAMKRSQRLLSAVITNAAPATVIGDPVGYEQFASTLETGSWPDLHDKLGLGGGLLPDDERFLRFVRSMYEMNDPKLMGRFVREFYTDADPQIDALRGIECPTLVLVGEKDLNLVEHCRLMAKEIPGAQLVELPGIGHMTALEAPDELTDRLTDFFTSPAVTTR